MPPPPRDTVSAPLRSACPNSSCFCQSCSSDEIATRQSCPIRRACICFSSRSALAESCAAAALSVEMSQVVSDFVSELPGSSVLQSPAARSVPPLAARAPGLAPFSTGVRPPSIVARAPAMGAAAGGGAVGREAAAAGALVGGRGAEAGGRGGARGGRDAAAAGAATSGRECGEPDRGEVDRGEPLTGERRPLRGEGSRPMPQRKGSLWLQARALRSPQKCPSGFPNDARNVL